MKNLKSSYLTIPIALVVVLIVTILLVVFQQNWKYYLIGAMLGCLTHGMMLKQSQRIERFAKLDPEGKLFNARKSSLLWMLARFVLIGVVFAAMIVLAYQKSDSDRSYTAISAVLALSGYLTIKIAFVIALVFFREKVETK